MDFSKLNNKLITRYLPVVKLDDLEGDHVYVITRIQWLTNEYGPTIVIDLDDKYTLYLPKRVVGLFSDEEGRLYFEAIKNLIPDKSIGYMFTVDRQHQFVPIKK